MSAWVFGHRLYRGDVDMCVLVDSDGRDVQVRGSSGSVGSVHLPLDTCRMRPSSVRCVCRLCKRVGVDTRSRRIDVMS